jgi:hypothetical protein
MKLPLIPLDKANHFIYGFFIYVLSNCFLNDLYSIGIVFLFALGKEIKDQIVYKGFDYKDLLITLLPGIILTLTNLITYI